MEQYIWGGSGQDYIYGGNNSAMTILNGNEGNDWISVGNRNGEAGTVTVDGGKGDDIINEVPEVFDANGDLVSFNFAWAKASRLAESDGT